MARRSVASPGRSVLVGLDRTRVAASCESVMSRSRHGRSRRLRSVPTVTQPRDARSRDGSRIDPEKHYVHNKEAAMNRLSAIAFGAVVAMATTASYGQEPSATLFSTTPAARAPYYYPDNVRQKQPPISHAAVHDQRVCGNIWAACESRPTTRRRTGTSRRAPACETRNSTGRGCRRAYGAHAPAAAPEMGRFRTIKPAPDRPTRNAAVLAVVDLSMNWPIEVLLQGRDSCAPSTFSFFRVRMKLSAIALSQGHPARLMEG